MNKRYQQILEENFEMTRNVIFGDQLQKDSYEN